MNKLSTVMYPSTKKLMLWLACVAVMTAGLMVHPVMYRPSIAQPSLKPELFGVTIQVRPGDTIDTIARRFETSASIVAAMNDLSTTSPLVIGATIIVPSEEDHKAIEGLQ